VNAKTIRKILRKRPKKNRGVFAFFMPPPQKKKEKSRKNTEKRARVF
jgi:hypothetical protein